LLILEEKILKRLLLAFILVTLVPELSFAQQAAKEAEIKRNVPYWKMLQMSPGITLNEYNEAVSELARRERGSVYSPSTRTYVPPRAYVPGYTPSVPERRSGSTTDPMSGNTYFWRKDSRGNTHVDGMNLNTGSMWQTEIKPNRSMNGWDSNMNPWNYDSRSKTYFNYGTGKMCVGEGYARTCF
jgi:hypothetical protein